MGLFRIEKARLFLSSHPPLILFVFCLGMTGIAFVSYAYYIKFHNIKNLNNQMDWNTMLHNATKINFCSSPSKISVTSNELSSNLIEYENVSMHINVKLHLERNAIKNETISSLKSAINSSLLGYSGEFGNRTVYLNIAPMHAINISCSSPEGCTKTLPTCVTIQAPLGLFPSTIKPTSCSVTSNTTVSSLSFSGFLASEDSNEEKCPVLLQLHHEDDETLFVYLTVETRSLVHVHLMHSSYFLFLMVILILAFGFLKGGPERRSNHSLNSNA